MRLKYLIPRIRKFKAVIHEGKGFIQGTGFNVYVEVIVVTWFNKTLLRFITNVIIDSKVLWTTDLQQRLKKITKKKK